MKKTPKIESHPIDGTYTQEEIKNIVKYAGERDLSKKIPK
jgi:hypothetical protein